MEKCLRVSVKLRRIAREFLTSNSRYLWEILDEQSELQNEEANVLVSEELRSLRLVEYLHAFHR